MPNCRLVKRNQVILTGSFTDAYICRKLRTRLSLCYLMSMLLIMSARVSNGGREVKGEKISGSAVPCRIRASPGPVRLASDSLVKPTALLVELATPKRGRLRLNRPDKRCPRFSLMDTRNPGALPATTTMLNPSSRYPLPSFVPSPFP